VNELITNTMKHAFNGGPKGVMKLSLQRRDDRGKLVFEDNGVGIPDSVDLGKTPGFGLQLVNRLSLQMKGTVRIERDSGTRFVIDFQC
ncbi:MAG TPA: sensor histidine kinase, partial [Spirochaetota bacterium]|nr:sensor histidine kinase [Spirochaetota bacterium]